MARVEVSLYEAKTQLSSLVERAAGGEEIVIAKNGKPMARLVPLVHTRVPRRSGRARGRIVIRESFWDPLPDDAIEAMEQAPLFPSQKR